MKLPTGPAVVALALLISLSLPLPASAQGTAFTYQGRLVAGGSPANGTYDLNFSVYDAPEGGTAIGNPVAQAAVGVTNGLFTITLDFGAGVFSGGSRWLDIAVRTNGNGVFTPLSPRQALTAAPYAILAGTVPDYAITSNKLAAGAVGSAQLAAGAIQAINIATGSVTAVQLAKPPRSGSVASWSLNVDFGQADFTVLFSPPFNNTPVVTLGLEAGYPPSLGQEAALSIKSRSSSGFTGRFTFPAPVQRISKDGVNCSLAMVNGAPAVAARGFSPGIQYVRATDTLGINWLSPVTIDSAGGGGDDTRLAVVNGNPAVAYHAYTGGVKFVRAADNNGTTWGTPITVIATNGSFLTLVIADGNPAIAYYEYPNSDLKFVRALDANGGTWAAPVAVDTAGIVGRFCSLAIVNGNPAVSYQDLSNNVLKFVRANDPDGARWGAPLVVDSIGGAFTSLAVVNGFPAIAYADGSNTKFVRALDANGAGWGSPVVVDQYAGSISLAVVNGRPAMSYLSDRLRYIRGGDANGATWSAPALLDSDRADGTSLLVLPTGVPLISYFALFSVNEPSGTLRVVREPTVSFTVDWIALEP